MPVQVDDDHTLFGPYRIVRRIGTGGMGSVFEAEDIHLGHRVALKLLHPHVAERPSAARRFLREGRAAARIRHPHVIQVFALGTAGATPYLAMELLDGGNLADLIARRGALPLRETLDLVLPVIAAVAAAHDAAVIHRDLKPSNICIAQGRAARPWPKVVDFGVSKVMAAGNEATATDAVIGTAAYMAPEQARAAFNASFQSDQYSLAVILFQCVTGLLPFGGRSLYEILESVMHAPVTPPSAHRKDLPQALDETVLRAMSRDAQDRFPSVRAFGAALLSLASEQTRASYAAELQDVEAPNTTVPVAREVTADSPGSMATPIRDSTAPRTASVQRKPQLVTKRTAWLALAALAATAIVSTSVPRAIPDPAPPLVSDKRAAPLPIPRSSVEIPDQHRVEPTVIRNESVASASSVPIAVSAPVRVPPPASARQDWPRRAAVPVSFGKNDAPILP